MNYRHAFHAGNHADVLKHAVLAWVIAHLKRKPAPFALLDTHAGAGVYDLESEEAARSPEYRDGVGRVWNLDTPELAALNEAWLSVNPDGRLRFYPGSPAVSLALMRPNDRLIACELHRPTFEALRSAVGRDGRAQLHARDGFAALKALLPFPEKRGLVMIDPPYEDRAAELNRTIEAMQSGLKRFGHGVWIWWRPVKSLSEIDAADEALLHGSKTEALRADLAVDAIHLDGGLAGSSLLVINPPFGLEAALRSLLPVLAHTLARSPHASWRVRTFNAQSSERA
jgi:23S rRNA (adenine2030-N6)-methyltransferase